MNSPLYIQQYHFKNIIHCSSCRKHLVQFLKEGVIFPCVLNSPLGICHFNSLQNHISYDTTYITSDVLIKTGVANGIQCCKLSNSSRRKLINHINKIDVKLFYHK